MRDGGMVCYIILLDLRIMWQDNGGIKEGSGYWKVRMIKVYYYEDL